MGNPAIRRIVLLSAALLLVRIASATIVGQPGYTDAYYYHDVARRLADGQGLTADFVWNPLEAGPGTALPVPSHRFWVPLATALQALGIVLLPFLDSFRASQLLLIAVASGIPLVTYATSRSLGAGERTGQVAAILAGLGGAFAPGWVSLDAFAPAAVLGTLFFLAYGRAARGDTRAGALAGLAVGLLFLARAEGALFGLALLPLARFPVTRRAGVAGSAIALCIGLAWLVRGLSLGPGSDLVARSALLVRYEDFFATQSPTWTAFAAAVPDVLLVKLGALGTNALTFAFAFGLLLVPGMAAAIRRRRADPTVRAFVGLLAVIYLFQSLAVTLHSTRGSYFHSLAAFVPFGVALGVSGTAALMDRMDQRRALVAAMGLAGPASRPRVLTLARTAGVGGVIAAVILSVFALAQWDSAFNEPYRARVAALERIPPGPFLAVDAAAWRWISGRTVAVTPADGLAAALCYATAIGARSIVLESAHFSAYGDLYRGRAASAAEAIREHGNAVRIYSLPAPSPSGGGCLP